MSHAGNILGISELKIERSHTDKGIEVWAKPSTRPCCLHCEAKQLVIKATHRRTIKHTRLGNQVMTLHLKVPKRKTGRTKPSDCLRSTLSGLRC